MTTTLLAAAFFIATAVASLRWLRVAQREHYLPRRVSSFSVRWWRATPANIAMAGVAVAAAVVATLNLGAPSVAAALLTFVLVVVGPLGLGLKGRTSPLRWTRRLRTVAGLTLVLTLVVAAAVLWLAPARALAILALLHPLLVDAALAVDSPIESLLGNRFVKAADRKLASLRPKVVGITGSYGKTTVKMYAAHLVGQTTPVLASRASFNNRMGLTLAINEDLGPGVDIFLAEMGTYGPGEISKLNAWLHPSVAVITAIGPVHLERMGSLENIVRAKSEITAGAEHVVLNWDSPHLRDLGERLTQQGMHVIRCSAGEHAADVTVGAAGDQLQVRLDGQSVTVPAPPNDVAPINLALALGICVALGTVPGSIEQAVRGLPSVANRLTVSKTPDGPTIIDDTYNANPAGAKRALQALSSAGSPTSRKLVVTPGMVELGRDQHQENAAFAEAIGGLPAELVVVGRTNRRALVDGYRGVAGADPVVVSTRDEAVAWVRRNGGPDACVLFENDLPDHFP